MHTGGVLDRDGWVRLHADHPGFKQFAGEDLVADGTRGNAANAGIDHIIALIRPENLPSQGVARRLGMALERTAQVHDAEVYVFGARLVGPT